MKIFKVCVVLMIVVLTSSIIYNNTYVDAYELGDFKIHYSADSTHIDSIEKWGIEIIPTTESIWGRGDIGGTVKSVRVKRKHLGLINGGAK